MAVLPIGIGSAAGGGGYQIERSLRFNSADSANLTRTFSAGSRTTWTLSMWLKRSAFSASAARDLFTVNNGTTDATYFVIAIRETDKLRIEGFNTNFRETTQVLRDVSAWYHLVVTVDTTNATAGNRIRMYLNGAEITTFSTSNNPTSSQSLGVNQAATHKIGALTSTYFDGYMTEVNFIDGQALTPSSFGETDTNTGVWKPKAFSGTYGTNGFYLKFADNSGTTSTTLGKDSSGNGNNWTPNNFSVTAGAGNDSLVDTPTNYGTDTGAGGEVRGNYCTLNPLTKNNSDTYTITNGNLDFDLGGPTSSSGDLRGTIGVSSGKWYWEVFCTEVTAAGNLLGITNNPTNGTDGFRASGAYTFQYYDDGTADTNKVQGTGGGSTSTNYGPNTNLANKTIGFALDLDGGTITIYIDGSSQGTMFSSLPSGTYFPLFCLQTAKIQVNFGQRPFAYTAPSGFKALCTQNLPTPTIGATSTTQANDYFNAVLYTGNGGTQTVSGVGFQPDFVWAKGRSVAYSNRLYDVIRGATNSLVSNNTDGEATLTTQLTAFASDGFTLGSDVGLNQSSATYVAWNWKAGSSNVTNTSGTITSTVSANTTSGFSIVTFNIPGSGTSDTVGHGLGVAPSMVILKPRTAGTSWGVYHSGLTSAAYYLTLQTTNGQTLSNNWWNSTAPTSSVFTIGATWYGTTNAVAYCFAPVAGYSAFGSYVANGSTDGVFVFCGFRPRFFLVKDRTSANDWLIYDTARNPYNLAGLELLPNSSGAEATGNRFDILSNGFKIRGSGGAHNTNGNTYIYAAFAESPFKYSLAR